LGREWHEIVRGVSFDVFPGRTLVILGDSGSGKSTLLRALAGLVEARGSATLCGQELLRSRPAPRSLRRHMQMVFQDPGGSLNPRLTLAQAVAEPLAVHSDGDPSDRHARACAMLERCGLGPPMWDRLPRQASGGQRQRAAIARALVLRPAVVLCDEPTSALDVSVQAQVLNLLAELRRELGVALVVITHDAGVAGHLADQVGVMRGGRLESLGPPDAVLGARPLESTNLAGFGGIRGGPTPSQVAEGPHGS
jgi:peptide/nickel transport system ATP-binding protein